MTRKIFLPLTQQLSNSIDKPNAIAMRKRLGGRISSDAAIARSSGPIVLGAFVSIQSAVDSPVSEPEITKRVGVLLAITGQSVDVYLERGIVKRTAVEAVSAHEGEGPADLVAVAESVMVFARLHEGQRVEVERSPSDIPCATLVEKCRYGAIVELEDRSLLGVGFRKIWPKQTPSTPGRPS
jgi:hypothetical protein